MRSRRQPPATPWLLEGVGTTPSGGLRAPSPRGGWFWELRWQRFESRSGGSSSRERFALGEIPVSPFLWAFFGGAPSSKGRPGAVWLLLWRENKKIKKKKDDDEHDQDLEKTIPMAWSRESCLLPGETESDPPHPPGRGQIRRAKAQDVPPQSPRHGTNLVGECCSESELCERAGGLLLRFTQAFSLGGGAGITFRGCFSSFGLELGEGASSSLVNVSFSKDFSLSLLRVAAGETRTNVGSQAKLQRGVTSDKPGPPQLSTYSCPSGRFPQRCQGAPSCRSARTRSPFAIAPGSLRFASWDACAGGERGLIRVLGEGRGLASGFRAPQGALSALLPRGKVKGEERATASVTLCSSGCPRGHAAAWTPPRCRAGTGQVLSPTARCCQAARRPCPSLPPAPAHLSRGRLSILLSSSSWRCSFSCSFCSRSSTSRSLAAVSTGLAPPKMEAARLDWGAGAAEVSSSLGALRGFRFSFGLWVGPGKEQRHLE